MQNSDEADQNLVLCPSFQMAATAGDKAPSTAPAADDSQTAPVPSHSVEGEEIEDDESHDGDETCSVDFEFASVSYQGSEAGDLDEAPVYPVFNREVLFFHGYKDGEENKKGEHRVFRVPLRRITAEEERDFLGSSEAARAAVEGVKGPSAEGSCCVLTPSRSPEMTKKSKSIGTGSSQRWRLRDLVMGRSRSDGKDKLIFFAPAAESASHAEKKGQDEAEGKKGRGKMDMAKAHRLFYAKKGGGGGGGDGGQQRRGILPYRKDMVGLFGGVHGAHARFLPF